MSEKQKYYLTTAIRYTSRKPHIGNTYEMVLTDAIARFKRLCGYDVFFLTGTDEHGLKIETAAKEEGITPKEYVDRITNELKGIWKLMNISYDKFIRTTDDYHEKAVQNIFRKLYEQGDIYKGEYEGWYCTPCESFWTEMQAVEGNCPDCGRPLERSKEAAYFLKLSKYQKKLEDYIESHPDFIYPEARKKEMVNNFIKPGVQDLCVSRSTFTWGVPIDFDNGHVIYVWMDALINYITALGYDIDEQGELFKKYWPANVQIIGKDILRFHTIYWPVILMALGLPMPEKIFGHPWLLVGMDKMSKSRGNAIYADDLANLFGSDAVRYYVLAEMPYLNDGSITYESFIARFNSDLANTLGNLVNRTVAMINKYFDGYVPSTDVTDEIDNDLVSVVESGVKKVADNFETFHIADAADEIMTILRRLNKYIDETTPWILGKDESRKGRLSTVMYNLYEGIRICATLLYPFMPDSCIKIMSQINDPSIITPVIENWCDAEVFGKPVPTGMKVNPKPEPLFVRIDEQKKMAEINAIKAAASEPAVVKEEKAEQEKTSDKKSDDQNGSSYDLIDIDHFAKVKLICAKIISAEHVEKSDKLLKIIVNDGSGERQVVSGIAKAYSPEDLIGKKVILVSNLKPAKLRGVESNGMLLAAGFDENGTERLIVNFLDDSIPEGSIIR